MEIIVPMRLDQEKSRQDFLHGKLKLLVYRSGPGQRREGELLRAYLCPTIIVTLSQITAKVSGFKQWKSLFSFWSLTIFVGQEFRQGTMSTTWLCSMSF